MELEIRSGAAHELEQIQQVARRTIDANYRVFLGNESVDWFIDSGASDQYLADNLENCQVLVAREQVLGFCVCKGNLIDLLMVDDDFHRHGFGTLLEIHCEKLLFAEFAEITLESFEGNDKANRFHRNHGWAESHRYFDDSSCTNKIVYVKRRDADTVVQG